VRYLSQIRNWEKAIEGWQTILKQRNHLIKMGGKDFFELFDSDDENEALSIRY